MRVLSIYCHPLLNSFHGDIREAALYAESFQPVLTEDERRYYFDCPRNQSGWSAISRV